MEPIKADFKAMLKYLILLTSLSLSGCFDDNVPPPKPEEPVKNETPVNNTPRQPTEVENDPVSEHWTETGEQTFDGKTCSTWWMVPNINPIAYFSIVKTYVSGKWPESDFQSNGENTARYRIIVGKNEFNEDKTAQVKMSLSDAVNSVQRVAWGATIKADDRIDASAILKTEADQVFRLAHVDNATSREMPQSLSGDFPRFLFPLGIPKKTGERYAPRTVPITSVFDHKMTDRFKEGISENDADWGVSSFDGGTASERFEEKTISGKTIYCFKKSGEKFLDGFNLQGSRDVLSYDGHPGFDFYAPIGTPVYAAAAGKVVFSGISPRPEDHGLIYIRILHDGQPIKGRFISQYLHLCATEDGISIGVFVTKGQLIGKSGQSGVVTGPHLHFEVKKNCDENGEGGIAIDPYGWSGNRGEDPYKQINKKIAWGNDVGDSVWMWEAAQ